MSYRNFRGRTRSGTLVVHEMVADDVLHVFERLFRARFPIERIDLPRAYRPPRPSDRFSTHNRTAAFNCRPATGSPDRSRIIPTGGRSTSTRCRTRTWRPMDRVLRRAARPFLDRTLREEGMIHRHDVVVRAFASIGWEWGGDWHTLKDYMHFSLTGR